jgi:hypothetical protein
LEKSIERVLLKYRNDAENFLYSYAGKYAEDLLHASRR